MDYIKREDVNRILYDLGVSEVYKLPSFWCHGGKDYQVIPTKYHNGYQQALADADEHIKGIPAADVVERKRGKWVESNPQNSDACRLINCSECDKGFIVGFNVPYEDWIEGKNFCFYCGADMREE